MIPTLLAILAAILEILGWPGLLAITTLVCGSVTPCREAATDLFVETGFVLANEADSFREKFTASEPVSIQDIMESISAAPDISRSNAEIFVRDVIRPLLEQFPMDPLELAPRIYRFEDYSDTIADLDAQRRILFQQLLRMTELLTRAAHGDQLSEEEQRELEDLSEQRLDEQLFDEYGGKESRLVTTLEDVDDAELALSLLGQNNSRLAQMNAHYAGNRASTEYELEQISDAESLDAEILREQIDVLRLFERYVEGWFAKNAKAMKTVSDFIQISQDDPDAFP
ncbi:MAG: hypothetical protein IPJ88_03560 [Myxococcales bacterium]|nr:MAG: hypothetical protein IPJ88_03560 [Myxococcales bacterium]